MKLSEWFSFFETSPTGFAIVVAVLLLIYISQIKVLEFVLFSTGFITMGNEILVIFAFQIFYGYIYSQIGLIVTVFLAGLLPGAFMGGRLKFNMKSVIIKGDLFLILMTLTFVPVIRLVSTDFLSVYFLVYGFLVSAVCGMQFSVAVGLSKDRSSDVVKAFSADLLGAACGAIILSVVLIPNYGLVVSSAVLIIIKILSLSGLGFLYEKN